MAELSATVIEGSKDGYPELEEKKDFILNVLNNEESKSNKTIDQGLTDPWRYGRKCHEEAG